MFIDESEIFLKKLKQLPEWPSIDFIFSKLDQINKLCWISGGAVRDLLLGKDDIQDVDLSTDATEEEILQLFPQAILVGSQFGVYKIPMNGLVVDLTVFRTEDGYLDGRRPLKIHRSSPQQDALRRDFTINALFWDIKSRTLVDFVGGVSDLKNKRLNCVGDPEVRFREDHLRVLRLARFSAQLGFEVSPLTYSKAIEFSSLTKNVSGERLFSEIIKIKNWKQRRQFYKDKLFLEIMKHNDLTLLHGFPAVHEFNQEASSLDLAILLEIFIMIGVSELNKNKINNRFKLSRIQLSWLGKIEDLKKLVDESEDFSDYVLKVDQSEDYLYLIKRFYELNFISQDVFMKIENGMLIQAEDSLIKAQDILNMVDRRDISKVLMSIRKQQILGVLKNRDEALSWIKNKQTKVKT